jgi:superoxide dismutase
MNIHHTKHHQAYVNNINNFIGSVRRALLAVHELHSTLTDDPTV